MDPSSTKDEEGSGKKPTHTRRVKKTSDFLWPQWIKTSIKTCVRTAHFVFHQCVAACLHMWFLLNMSDHPRKKTRYLSLPYAKTQNENKAIKTHSKIEYSDFVYEYFWFGDQSVGIFSLARSLAWFAYVRNYNFFSIPLKFRKQELLVFFPLHAPGQQANDVWQASKIIKPKPVIPWHNVRWRNLLLTVIEIKNEKEYMNLFLYTYLLLFKM